MSIPGSLGNGFSTARGINDLGQVVGGAAPNGTSVAFLLDHGVVTNLLTPTGAVYGLAVAINNNGQVLVNGGAGSQSGTFVLAQGTQRQIPSLGGLVRGAALNDLGHVVGESSPAGAKLSHAFLQAAGPSVDLGVLPGGATGGDCGFCVAGNFSAATAVNDFDEVVGQSAAAGEVLHAFVWRHGVMADLGTLPGDNRSFATSINNRGQIVGWSGHSTGIIIDYTRPVLWTDGSVVDLSALIPANSGWVLDVAVAINSRGQIAGTGHRNGFARPFLLTPIHASERVIRRTIEP